MSLGALIAHGIPHAVSCRALGVSQAWFYQWRNGDESPRRHRRKALAAVICYVFTKHHGSYGSPRITTDVRDMAWLMSKSTVAQLMAEQGGVKGADAVASKPDRSARKAPGSSAP